MAHLSDDDLRNLLGMQQPKGQLRRNTRVRPVLSAAEMAARLAGLKGESCHSCFHGQLDEHGNCDFCEYRYTDYHDII